MGAELPSSYCAYDLKQRWTDHRRVIGKLLNDEIRVDGEKYCKLECSMSAHLLILFEIGTSRRAKKTFPDYR